MRIPFKKKLPAPDPLLEETREFWREIGREVIRQSVTPINEAAKQIVAVAAILEGLYFHAITFANLRGKVSTWPLVVYLIPIVLLLISLSAALLIFFPKRYALNIHSSDASQSMHEDIIKHKMLFLWIASSFLVLGVVGLFFAVLIYLLG